MATVTGYTAAYTESQLDETIVDASLVGDNLVLEQRDGTTIDVGSVRGPAGTDAAPGDVNPTADTTPIRTTGGRTKVGTPTATDDATTKAYVDAADTTLDGRLDTLEGQTLDSRLDIIEAGLTSVDPASWIQTGWGNMDTTSYGPVHAHYDPVRKWIEIEMYISRTGANTSSLSIHSPIIVASTYRPARRVNLSCINNIGGTEAIVRMTMLHATEANAGRMDIVFASARVWSTNQYAMIKGGWKVP